LITICFINQFLNIFRNQKIKHMKILSSRLFLTFSTTILLFSCQKLNDVFHPGEGKPNGQTKFNTFKGPEVQFGEGKARSWITISDAGAPSEIGVELSNETLSGLPDTNISFVLPLHKRAIEATPFEHIYITWSAHGHPLPGTSIGPHFDVRFFMMTNEERLAIPPYASAPAAFDNFPPAGYMPANYFPDAARPQLGYHWTDKNFPGTVTKAMILGTYNGEFTFVSPIMIKDVLASGQTYSVNYAQPHLFAEANTWYPTKYNIYKDNGTQKHYITLSGFVLR
jgi:hypothetical protein